MQLSLFELPQEDPQTLPGKGYGYFWDETERRWYEQDYLDYYCYAGALASHMPKTKQLRRPQKNKEYVALTSDGVFVVKRLGDKSFSQPIGKLVMNDKL